MRWTSAEPGVRSMRLWTRAYTSLLVLAAASLAGHGAGVTAQSLVLSAVVVRPVDVHPGDTIWVSGNGFPPRQQVKVIYSACPDFFHDTTGTGITKAGPMADAKGQFTAFPFPAVGFARVDRPQKCTIYATVGNNPFPDITGNFYILPTTEKLDRCDRAQCGVKVRAHPARAQVGSREAIGITGGWPGSRAVIAVSVPGMRDQQRTVTLDWTGSGATTMRVQAHLSGSADMQVHVRAQVRLGTANGNAAGAFTVVR